MLRTRRATAEDFEPRFLERVGSPNESDWHQELWDQVRAEYLHHISSPHCMSVSVDSLDGRESRMLGTMSACCVTQELADHIVDRGTGFYPYPKLLAWEAAGKKVYLSESEIGAANSGPGLELFFAYAWIQKGPPEQRTKVRATLSRGWLDRYRGCKVKRLFINALDELIPEVETVGLINWWQCDNGFGTQVAMMGVTREDQVAMSNPFIAELFAYMPPQIHFSRAERELLQHAVIDKLSDQELSTQLCLTLDTIKARWKSALNRAHTRIPTLFNGASGWGSHRRQLIEYVEMNREELWPYKAS